MRRLPPNPARSVLHRFSRLSYRNKLLILMMAMVLFVGGAMGVLIRLVILPHLSQEMERHAEVAAARLSMNIRGFVLNRDTIHLTGALFEEKQLVRGITYIAVTDEGDHLLAHTFVGGVPAGIAQPDTAGKSSRASEIRVPIHEGIYQVGTIRIGIDTRYFNAVIDKMNLFHIGFTVMITGLSLLCCVYLSQIFTRPITLLTRLAGEISFGRLDTCISVGPRMGHWEVTSCGRASPLPATSDGPLPPPAETRPAWVPAGTEAGNDEIVLLADAFNHMTRRLSASEEELRLSEQNYRLIFDSNPNPVLVIAADSCRILAANERALEVFGRPGEILIGREFTQIGFQEDVPLLLDALQRLNRATNRWAHFARIRCSNPARDTFWVNLHLACCEHMGRPALIATTTDITDIVEAETKMVQAGKMATLGEMSAGVAHELNQPLNAIKLGSEFLLTVTETGKPLPQDQLREVSSAISKEVDRASAIITHLREFGRKSSISKQPVDINTAVRGALTLVGQQIRVHGIRIVTELCDSLPPILADENRVEQVVINLLTNARDAMEKKPETGGVGEALLTIRSFVENGRVVVTLADTGMGIPARLRSRIFEPFFTTKPVGRGTGLGLSISYGIVRDFDGTIEFETEEGVGTRFKIGFPVFTKGA